MERGVELVSFSNWLVFFVLLTRYNKAKNDLAQAEKKVHQLETRNNELTASLHQMKSDLARAIEERKVTKKEIYIYFFRLYLVLVFYVILNIFVVQEVVSERDKLVKQIPELQQQLETELLARTDLENRNMTLKEELAFKQQVKPPGCIQAISCSFSDHVFLVGTF